MKVDVDFGKIQGTQKPTLYQPGAEKLALTFQLHEEIVGRRDHPGRGPPVLQGGLYAVLGRDQSRPGARDLLDHGGKIPLA